MRNKTIFRNNYKYSINEKENVIEYGKIGEDESIMKIVTDIKPVDIKHSYYPFIYALNENNHTISCYKIVNGLLNALSPFCIAVHADAYYIEIFERNSVDSLIVKNKYDQILEIFNINPNTGSCIRYSDEIIAKTGPIDLDKWADNLWVNPNSRYEKECFDLCFLVSKQLNLEKNAKKGKFEDLEIHSEKKVDLFFLLEDEISELKEELLDDSSSCYNLDCECGGQDIRYKVRKEINFQRVREEIGDVAACLVGLLAKLNKMEKENELNRAD